MNLVIHFTGGMGVSYSGSVDLATLPEELQARVQSELSESNLAKLSKRQENQFATGSVIYEFQYQHSSRKFSINEAQLTDEIVELVDSLTPFLRMLPKGGQQE